MALMRKAGFSDEHLRFGQPRLGLLTNFPGWSDRLKVLWVNKLLILCYIIILVFRAFMAYDLLIYACNEVSTNTVCTRYAGKAESNTQIKSRKDIGSKLKNRDSSVSRNGSSGQYEGEHRKLLTLKKYHLVMWATGKKILWLLFLVELFVSLFQSSATSGLDVGHG